MNTIAEQTAAFIAELDKPNANPLKVQSLGMGLLAEVQEAADVPVEVFGAMTGEQRGIALAGFIAICAQGFAAGA